MDFISGHWRRLSNERIKERAISPRPFSPSSIVSPTINSVAFSPLIETYIMTSPPPTPRKDVLSRLRPQRIIHRKNSETTLNAHSLSPPAAFTQFRKQLSTRIKNRDKDKGSFYIKDGVISDGIVNNRKRVAVSNGKIAPGEDGTELDLDLEEDEVEIEMAEGKEIVRDEQEPEEDDEPFPPMGDWDVSIDGGKFDIGPSFRAQDFMAELEGTTPAIVVELEGSAVPAEVISESPIQEKEGDSPIQEKESDSPVRERERDWRPQQPETPVKQVRHVGHLVKDNQMQLPARKDSLLVSPMIRGGTVKGEAERFITPLFSPVSPLERSNPIDQLYLGRSTGRGGTPEERNTPLDSIEERDSPMERSPHPTRQLERFASPLEHSQPTNGTNQKPERLPRNKPTSTTDQSLVHPLLRKKPSNNTLRSESPLFHNNSETRSESPQQYLSNSPSNTQKDIPAPLEPQTFTLEPRTYSEDRTRSMERVASPTYSNPSNHPTSQQRQRAGTLPPTPISRPQSAHRTTTPSPQRTQYTPTQTQERTIRPLSAKSRADTLPLSPSQPIYRAPSKATSVNTIKRKQLPIRQDSVGYAVEVELRKVEAEKKLARERQAEEDAEKRSSNEVSWLSL